MRLRQKRFPRRRGIRIWRKRNNRNQRSRRWGILTKVVEWWNRRQLYTFHKDEIITHKNTCSSPVQATNDKDYSDDEVEWNNESESENMECYSDTASKHDPTEDKSSLASDLGEDDDIETLKTIEEDSPFLDDTLVTIEEEESSLEESPRIGSKPKVYPPLPSQPPQQPPLSPSTTIKAIRNNHGTVDSISGSLESMDSLVSSQWDPEDDSSTVTPLVTNIHPTNDAFFVEHMRFLQIQTQPRRVETVYHHDDSKEKPANE